MEFEKLAAERFSVRKFKDIPVEAEKIKKIMETGRIAPTASNRQPQRLLVLTDPADLEKIDQTTRCRFGANLVVAVCADTEDCWVSPIGGQKSWQVDASIVTSYMMLQAQDLGLGSLWVMFFDMEKFSALFSLPGNIVPLSLLVIGYAADDAAPSEKHAVRYPLDHTVLNYEDAKKYL